MMSWSTAQVEAGPGVWHKFAHRCLQGSRLDVHCNLRLLACLVPAAAHATVALVLPGIDCSCLSWRPRRAGRQGAVWRRQLLSRARARAARAGALGEPGCWAWPGRLQRGIAVAEWGHAMGPHNFLDATTKAASCWPAVQSIILLPMPHTIWAAPDRPTCPHRSGTTPTAKTRLGRRARTSSPTQARGWWLWLRLHSRVAAGWHTHARPHTRGRQRTPLR